MKKIVALLVLCSVSIITYSQGFIWNKEMEDHHKTYKRVQSTRSILPSHASLEKYLPYTHNQGRVGMCAAYSVATCRNIIYARNHNLTDKDKISAESYSPYYIYQRTLKSLGRTEKDWANGMPMFMRFINSFGFAKIKDVEYPYYYPFTSECLWNFTVPTHSNIDIESIKSDTFDYIRSILPSNDTQDATSDLITQMKSEIVAGRPMIFGMFPMPESLNFPDGHYWADSMIECQNWDCDTLTNDPSGYCSYSCTPSTYEPGGHAMVLIGYDDNRMVISKGMFGRPKDTTYVGCFQIVNSWGSSWGDDGKLWIEYEAFVNHAELVQSVDKRNQVTLFDQKSSSSTPYYYGKSSSGEQLETKHFSEGYRSFDWIFRVPIFGFEDVSFDVLDDTTVEFSSEEIYLKGSLRDGDISHGVLKDNIKNSEYEGDIKNWSPHGKGVLTLLDDWGDVVTQYHGYFEDGEYKNGYGLEKKDGQTYKGDFKYSQRHGKGSLFDYTGDEYIGDFAYGRFSGTGTMNYSHGWKYIGEWMYGEYEGQGTLYYSEGPICYEGEWEEGKEEGQGVMYYLDGTIYHDGEWKDGYPVEDEEENDDFYIDTEEDIIDLDKNKGLSPIIAFILLLLR